MNNKALSPTILWTKDEISLHIQGSWLNAPDNLVCTGVNIYSKQVTEGDLVFTTNSKQWPSRYPESHNFLDVFLKKGASAVIIHQIPPMVPSGLPLYIVNNTRTALANLASAARKRLTGKVIAITGSAGKTTTREMTKTLLGAFGSVSATRKNYNHRTGLQLTFAQTPQHVDFTVCEFAVGHPSNLQERLQLTRPDIAVFTNIYGDHLRFYPTLRDVAHFKSKLFDVMPSNGIAIINKDNEYFEFIYDEAKKRNIKNILTFGLHEKSDIRAEEIELCQDHSMFALKVFGKQQSCHLPVAGQHNILNFLAAVSVLSALDLDTSSIGEMTDLIQLPALRNEEQVIMLQPRGSFLLIADVFNSNFGSIQAGLKVLQLKKLAWPGYAIAVLGQIHGLGAASREQHEKLAEEILNSQIDKVFTLGENMKYLAELLPKHLLAAHANTADEIADKVSSMVRPGDVVYVKGWTLGRERVDVIITTLQNLAKRRGLVIKKS